MSDTSPSSKVENSGSVQYIDLVVERCLDKGRVSFKNSKQMGRVLQLQDFPSFVFDDWQKQDLLAPESGLLGEYAIIRAVPGADAVAVRTGVNPNSSKGTLGYLVPNGEWITAGAQWTAETTVGWGRWIFRMDEAKTEVVGASNADGEDDTEPPTSARSDAGPPVSAEEKRVQFDSALTLTRDEPNSKREERYVFKPALQHMVNKINHHIIQTMPMIDTVMTCEEWGDLLLDLDIRDGPVVTSHVLVQQPARFVELPEWNPPEQDIVDIHPATTAGGGDDPHSPSVGDPRPSSKRKRLLNAAKGLVVTSEDGPVTCGPVNAGVEQNKGGMLFTTSDYPELDAAAVILFAKRLSEKMTTFIRTHEYKLTEDLEFARDTQEDSQERLQLSQSERLLEVNKLFHLHLTKTLKRLREQRTLSIQEIAESLDADCLAHFPGDWPKEELGDEVCV